MVIQLACCSAVEAVAEFRKVQVGMLRADAEIRAIYYAIHVRDPYVKLLQIAAGCIISLEMVEISVSKRLFVRARVFTLDY